MIWHYDGTGSLARRCGYTAQLLSGQPTTGVRDSLDTPLIAFIGAGNMATSIVGGLLESGYPAARIRAADPYPASLERLRGTAPVATFADNGEAAAGADVVILAVKPQVMAAACGALAPALAGGSALVISIAAGITVASLQRWLGAGTAVVRCMPNTPALLRCGASGLYASAQVSAAQRQYAARILAAVGSVEWLPTEHSLDAVTALSGSGPAYFFLFTEAMIEAGRQLGLDADTATHLAQQTALGAARMGLESDVDLVELRRRVTSPGGTTQAAVESFEAAGLRQLVKDAMQAAAERAAEMARELG